MHFTSHKPYVISISLVTVLSIALNCSKPHQDAGQTSDTTAISQSIAPVHPDTNPDISPAPWKEAKARGVAFRGIGQEPGWIVEIDTAGRMRINANYGTIQDSTLVVLPTTDASGKITYATHSKSHIIKFVTELRPCQDAMSGEAMDYTVIFTLDSATWNGCGKKLR